MYKKYITKPSPENKKLYFSYRNIFVNICRNAKINYFHSKFAEIKNNIKRTWNVINTVISPKKRTRHSIPNNMSHDDIKSTGNQNVCEYFNNYFINIGLNINTN